VIAAIQARTVDMSQTGFNHRGSTLDINSVIGLNCN
jgi:hypothetical protein